MQQLPSCQGKAKGQENLQGDETSFLNAELGLTTIPEVTVSAGAASSGQGQRPTQQPTRLWPLLRFCPAAPCSGLSGTCRKQQIHPSAPRRPPKYTHLWSLRPPLLPNAVFAGRLFVYQKPRIRGACNWREPSSRTPSKLNIDQRLFQRASAAGRANSSQRPGAKPRAVTSLGAALTSKDV